MHRAGNHIAAGGGHDAEKVGGVRSEIGDRCPFFEVAACAADILRRGGVGQHIWLHSVLEVDGRGHAVRVDCAIEVGRARGNKRGWCRGGLRQSGGGVEGLIGAVACALGVGGDDAEMIGRVGVESAEICGDALR